MSNDRYMHFDVNERRSADSINREVTLKVDGESKTIAVLYEIFDMSIGAMPVLDGLVQGILMHGMKRGLPLRIHGTLSGSALHNLHEFQRAWSLWRPDVYRRIDLIPDSVVALDLKSSKAIQAFSGGVDASFTLISNKILNRDRGGYDISAAMFVHGFDVAYDDGAGFARLVERFRRTLDDFGVELKLVRTNSKLLNLQSWMDSSALQLTACLHQFSNQYGTALMGSAEPYDALWMPISSNPMSDPLLSGDLQTVIHDGAGYSRTEKVEAIASFPVFVDGLKVCWEGEIADENCGRCEKCLRTRLNFAAAGYNEPGCFSGSFNPKMLRRLRANTAIQVSELKGIVTYVRRRRLSYPWLNALHRRIMLSRLAIPIARVTRWPEIRAWLRKTLRSQVVLRP